MLKMGTSIGPGKDRVVTNPLNPGPGSGFLVELAAIADGGFAEVEADVDGQAESLILYRDGDAVRAWLNVCPHAGRRLDWSPGQFLKSKDGLLVCAVHGASFALGDGTCVAGPCRGDALRAVAVEVRGEGVYLAG